MSLVADAFQPFVKKGLLNLQGTVQQTLEDLLQRRGCYPSFDSTTNAWELDFLTPETVSPFMATECARFACASFQSFKDVKAILVVEEYVPWALVRAYYSAFYAGHALMRALGQCCTYVDGPRAAILRGIVATYGLSQPLPSGQYVAEATGAESGLRLVQLGSSYGGTHEAFWKVFVARLARLEADVLRGSMTAELAQSVNLLLGRVREVITRKASDVAWLSTIRNAIQYRQALDVWYPTCRLGERDKALLARLARGWESDPMGVEIPVRGSGRAGSLADFVAACSFLVGCCRELFLRIDRIGRAGQKRSFAYHGPIRYLLMHKLWNGKH